MNNDALPLRVETSPLTELSQIDSDNDTRKCDTEGEHHKEGYEEVPDHTPKEFATGLWLDPSNDSHGRGKCHQAIYAAIDAVAQGEVDLEHTESAFVVLADDKPANYQEAINSPDSEWWKASMKKEYETLTGYNTWELVEKPPNTNIIGCRWTYHVKHDNLGQTNELKSQLVAQGFSQIPGLNFDATYSPTICFTSIQLILALTCHYNLELQHIDVKGAYLNGVLENNVYMKQPKGFVESGQEHMVCKLKKGLYGLKQSGRVWHQTLKCEMEKLGFMSSDANTTVFFHFSKDKIEIVRWYVDNGLVATSCIRLMEHIVKDIGGSFNIQDLGKPDRLLRIKIMHDHDLGTIQILQPSFINTILRHFDITSGRAVSSPMDPSADLCSSTNTDSTIDIPYASLIGSINYCAISTQPDIAFATNKCAQFTSRPNLSHWEAAKRVVHYLLNMRDHGIKYTQAGNGVEGYTHNLAGFTDADFAGDTTNCRSTTGWVFTFNGAPISWASKKQSLVMHSSMEAKLMAGSITSAEGIWLIRLGKDFRHDLTPIPLLCGIS